MPAAPHQSALQSLLPALLATLIGGAQAAGNATDGTNPQLVTALPAVRAVDLTGFTRALAAVRLVAEVAGRVRHVGVDIGQAIPPDGTFARIDDTFIRLERDEVLVQEERLTSQIAFARREVERYQELARQKNTSASQLDTLEQTLRDNAHALRGTEIKRRVLEERLARTQIRAPAGWLVTARAVEPGQWVQVGEVVGEAADFSALLVPFALTPEQYAALTGEAASAEGLRLDMLDLGTQVRAGIYRTNPGFDPATRKVLVDLRIETPLPERRGGLRARLALPLPERTGAVLLPASAVEERYEEFWVTREDGARVPVVRLGAAGDPGMLRIASPQIQVGERFRMRPD